MASPSGLPTAQHAAADGPRVVEGDLPVALVHLERVRRDVPFARGVPGRRELELVQELVPLPPELDRLGCSVQSVQLVAAFEEEFGIEMDEDMALAVQTVADANAFIGQYL